MPSYRIVITREESCALMTSGLMICLALGSGDLLIEYPAETPMPENEREVLRLLRRLRGCGQQGIDGEGI